MGDKCRVKEKGRCFLNELSEVIKSSYCEGQNEEEDHWIRMRLEVQVE